MLKIAAKRINQLSELSGRALAWLVLALVLLVSYDVLMRYLFQRGSIALQELEWHLFSIIFLLGAAYTYKHDDHVRLDLFYRSKYLGDRQRIWIDIAGGVFFLLPFCCFIIIGSWPFVFQAFIHAEGSPDPGGLDYRWILKAAIPVGFFLLALQGVADVIDKFGKLADK